MAINTIRFSCSTLKGTGKQGILKPDANGYYTLPIGGLDVWNSAGEFYTYEGAKDLFTQSGAFMRRMATGCLKSELGHPEYDPKTMSMEQFANRIMRIDPKNVVAHIPEVWLDFDNVRDSYGKPVIAIMGKVIPSGPHAQVLQRSLNNPKEEVCFSIRAFTDDNRVRGINHRALREIVTFDHVVEGGIQNAKKFYSPSLESFTDVTFSKEQLSKAFEAPAPVEGVAVAMEASTIRGQELLTALGWSATGAAIPKYLQW